MTYYYNGFPQSEHDEKLNLINVDQLEEDAKRVIPEGAYYYIASVRSSCWLMTNRSF